MKLQLEISNFYSFRKSEEVANDFLSNVRSNIKANGEVMIKHGFSIENIQPAPTEYSVPVLNIWYWSTEPYKMKYFNGFIFYSFKEEILKQVNNYDMSSSSWRFNKFVYFNLKVLQSNSGHFLKNYFGMNL